MTRILVTGGTGLLGSTLVPHLRARGHDVVSCARKGGDVHVDLTDARETVALLDGVEAEVVVNLAANTNVDQCESDPHAAYLGNTRVVENIARWTGGTSGTHLVQISTDQVYDGTGPHAERDVTLLNYYAFSKLAGELAAAAVPSTILRTNFFGRSGGAPRQTLSDWIVGALRRAEAITVFEDVWFSPLSLATLAEMIERVVDRRHRGVFNLGSHEGMSKADFATRVAERLALPKETMRRGKTADVRLIARRPTDMRMDSRQFEHTFDVRLPSLAEEIDSVTAEYAHDLR